MIIIIIILYFLTKSRADDISLFCSGIIEVSCLVGTEFCVIWGDAT